MPQFTFGSGLMVVRRTDVGANPTPRRLGVLQEGTIEFSSNLKELHGGFQDAEAVGRGARKVTGKAKFASINARALNDMFFDGTVATGQQKVAIDEAGTVPGSSAYTVTVANAATFLSDMGVIDATTGLELTRGATATGAGVYSVNEASGVYTFSAADASKPMLFTYLYSVATGRIITLSSKRIGVQPYFEVIFNRFHEGKESTVRLLKCTSSKLSAGSKLEDFDIQEFDFQAMLNPARILGFVSSDE